jgi:hypothetical protein
MALVGWVFPNDEHRVFPKIEAYHLVASHDAGLRRMTVIV